MTETPLMMQNNGSVEAFTPVGSKQEAIFLEGPHSRWGEFLFALDVFKEFIYGFRKLHFVGACVTVFGSARFPETHPYYETARIIGRQLARMGFTIMTGGGPGIMEAANRGAKEAGGRSIGCNIVLPKEQRPNKYLDKWIYINYFFIRKILLTKYSFAFVVMPGGYGTMDEFFESITMMQTGKSKKFPVILIGRSYHLELYEYIQKMVYEKTISPEDIHLFLFTDSVDEAIEYIRKHAVKGFGLKKKRKIQPLKWLGEKR
jgi:uncharacterized protein (TIGR00730 family)